MFRRQKRWSDSRFLIRSVDQGSRAFELPLGCPDEAAKEADGSLGVRTR